LSDPINGVGAEELVYPNINIVCNDDGLRRLAGRWDNNGGKYDDIAIKIRGEANVIRSEV